jgi:hypothetical protein
MTSFPHVICWSSVIDLFLKELLPVVQMKLVAKLLLLCGEIPSSYTDKCEGNCFVVN